MVKILSLMSVVASLIRLMQLKFYKNLEKIYQKIMKIKKSIKNNDEKKVYELVNSEKNFNS